jgi:SAM-dependent methyltransferase
VLDAILQRRPLAAWSSTGKIPWDEPGFSRRMLREHLSQAHDAASRKTPTIEAHVEWIHSEVLRAEPSRVLDLGCGPGLYTERLARRGHDCLGVDFSPASIEYARDRARTGGLSCEYLEGDIRGVHAGEGFDAVLLINGELNAFAPDDAAAILRRARSGLRRGGKLVTEVHDAAAIEAIGRGAPSWYAASAGLFSDDPHVCLKEAFFDREAGASIERYLVIDIATSSVFEYTNTLQAYDATEYESLFRDAGFDTVERHSALSRDATSATAGYEVWIAGRADGGP